MTQRDLIEHISTLRTLAGDFRAVAAQPRIQKMGEIVPINPAGALENADRLNEIADDLMELVVETPVRIP